MGAIVAVSTWEHLALGADMAGTGVADGQSVSAGSGHGEPQGDRATGGRAWTT